VVDFADWFQLNPPSIKVCNSASLPTRSEYTVCQLLKQSIGFTTDYNTHLVGRSYSPTIPSIFIGTDFISFSNTKDIT
jgi:hypothetical protein